MKVICTYLGQDKVIVHEGRGIGEHESTVADVGSTQIDERFEAEFEAVGKPVVYVGPVPEAVEEQ